MIFSYGQGSFKEGAHAFDGEIILSEHKLYLRSGIEEIPQTFIPLEKIVSLKASGSKLAVSVFLSASNQYTAIFEGKAKYINDLTKDIAYRRGFKKKLLRNHWVEPPS